MRSRSKPFTVDRPASLDPDRNTVSGQLLTGIIACAGACGIPGHRLRITREPLCPEKRYGGYLLKRLWGRICRTTEDSLIGYRMACEAGPLTFGVLNKKWTQSGCLLEALLNLERYLSVMYQGTGIRVNKSSGRVIVNLEFGPSIQAAGRQSNLWVLSNIALLPKRIGMPGIEPDEIAYGWPSPGPRAEERLNRAWHFKFDSPTSSVSFDLRDATRPIVVLDQKRKAFCSTIIDEEVAALPKDGTLAASLAVIIRPMIDYKIPSIGEASELLGLSVRTLQRRLNKEGTSFQDVLAEVQCALADQYLLQDNLSQREAAQRLGYSDVAGFSRAYRLWTGRPPGGAGRPL